MSSQPETNATTEARSIHVEKMLMDGATRADIVAFAKREYNISERCADSLLAIARKRIVDAWNIERPQLVAELLSQYMTLQAEARRSGQLSVALGCLNAVAKVARL